MIAGLLRMDASQLGDLLRRLRLRLLEAPWLGLRRMRDRALEEPLPLRLRRVERANLAALARYEPQPYSGDVVLFRAPVANPGDGGLGWDAWIEGGIEVHEIPGSHHDLIARPELADGLRRCIASKVDTVP